MKTVQRLAGLLRGRTALLPQAIGDQAQFAQTPWQAKLKTDTRAINISGYLILCVFLGGTGVWAMTAPLDAAVITSGVIVAAGQNVAIQHLEGGIVRSLDVVEGQHVKAGDVLMTLDQTEAETQLNRLVRQASAIQAQAARLGAERDGLASMVADSAAAPAYDVSSTVTQEQQKEFNARYARYVAETDILNQQIAAHDEAALGLKSRASAVRRELELVEREVAIKQSLLDEGLTNRTEYTGLLRDQAELTGQLGDIDSQIASNAIQSIEAKRQVERAASSRVEEAVSQLNTINAQLADLNEQAVQARAVLERTVIRSPADGTILRVHYNTPGSIVRAGEPLIDLLPTTQELIIEARIQPQDIDVVHIGQKAMLRFTALNTRTTPEVLSTVYYVSADRFVDPASQHAYYLARLKIDGNLPTTIATSQIYPGMPVATFFSMGQRTFADYLVRPIIDSMSKAFREAE